MTHRFPIKVIAAQAGLGPATIDRVLNDRAHVSAQTKARVHAAIDELTAQESQLAARGRTVWVDVVIEAPLRFSREVRRAAEATLPRLHPVIVRPRFTIHEEVPVSQTVAALRRIAKRGSDGVVLKARDVPEIRSEIAAMAAKGIPVVTLVTDVVGRNAYVGVDNTRAGQTAAALISRQVLSGTVLTNISRDDFAGEAARIAAFRAAMAEMAPNVAVVALQNAAGLNTLTSAAMSRLPDQAEGVTAVYSAGGGNRGIVASLPAKPTVYVAHDLDSDNRRLLEAGQIDFVLHHDLTHDMQTAFRHILAGRGLMPAPEDGLSDVQIILRENLPAH